MSDFDPDAFLAAPAAAPIAPLHTPAPITPASAQAPTPEASDFDPDAFLADKDQEQYGTPGQQVIAGIEGAAKGVAGPLATYAEKHILDVPQEDIAGRERANPWTGGVGEAAGLVGSTLLGTGLGSALAHVGQAADVITHAPEAISLAHKVGSAVVKGAAEMAALQSSDEAAKYVVTDADPGTAAETAIGNIGLAAALGGVGGGFMKGAVSPLWEATAGPKVESALKTLTDKFGGVNEGGVDKVLANRASSQLEADSGIVLPPELKGVIDDIPGTQTHHSALSQSDTTVGRHYQAKLADVESQAADKVLGSLGRDASSIEKAPEVDKYTSGRDMGESLADSFEKQSKPISARYDSINEEFKNSPVSDNTKKMIADQVAQVAMDKGWHKASDDASLKVMEKFMSKLPEQETVADLKNEITNLRNSYRYDSPGYQAAKSISSALNNGLEDTISENMGIKGGAAKIAEYTQLRSDYKNLMQQAEALNEHLHVGRYQGPQSFVQAIREMSSANGENILNRLSGKNKADVLNQLKNYPEVLEKVKNYHIDNLIDQAVKKAPPGKTISMNKLMAGIETASPQIKELIASPEQHKTIQAAGSILEGLKDPTHNFSNTARTIQKLTHGTMSPLSLLAMLTGHGEVGVASYLGSLAAGNARDGAKLALMKFLSSDKPVNAAGFRALVSFANATAKGENTVNKAVANVFKPGASVLIDSQLPSAKDLVKLDKLIGQNNDNPEAELHNDDSQLGHYMPNHQVAATQVTQQAQQYLASLKPQPHQAGPLDRPIEPTAQERLRYERALTIAQQPATVMQHIKDGTLQPSDVQDLHNIYPGLYKKYAEKLSNEMQNHHSDEEPIPYKTRMGISLFLGQPIDSSMSPMSIQAAQPKPKAAPPQPQNGSAKSMKSLGKSNKSYQTPLQGAESDRANRD